MFQYVAKSHGNPRKSTFMPMNTRKTEYSLRSRVARGILSDAEMKAFGRTSRIEKLTSALCLAVLLTGFLLANQNTTHTTGWIVFFGGLGCVLGVAVVGLLPSVRCMQARLARAGLEAATEMRLPELLAARWAIGEMARAARVTRNHY